jgi:DNA (cytosine-5)-methyltransferase 1
MVVSDIQDVSPTLFRKLLGGRRLHILAGCAPCQGFCSLTAKWRRDDSRNNLVLQMARYVEELEPDVVFMENVPGLATRGRSLLDELLTRLSKAGYYCESRTVQMADYGVPQNRRRFVLLGGRGFMIPFPGQTHARKPNEQSHLRPWVTLRDTVYGWSAPDTLSRSWRTGGPSEVNWHVVRDLKPWTKRRLRAAMPGQTWLGGDEQLRPRCHQNGYNGFTNVYGRMSWDLVAPTITSGCTTPCKGRFGHPDRRRTTISVREAAVIQTFPERYRFETDQIDAVCNMIGNAVPPQFARIIGRQVHKTLREHYATLAGRFSR